LAVDLFLQLCNIFILSWSADSGSETHLPHPLTDFGNGFLGDEGADVELSLPVVTLVDSDHMGHHAFTYFFHKVDRAAALPLVCVDIVAASVLEVLQLVGVGHLVVNLHGCLLVSADCYLSPFLSETWH
jgi:hypothetical protein